MDLVVEVVEDLEEEEEGLEGLVQSVSVVEKAVGFSTKLQLQRSPVCLFLQGDLDLGLSTSRMAEMIGMRGEEEVVEVVLVVTEGDVEVEVEEVLVVEDEEEVEVAVDSEEVDLVRFCSYIYHCTLFNIHMYLSIKIISK